MKNENRFSFINLFHHYMKIAHFIHAILDELIYMFYY